MIDAARIVELHDAANESGHNHSIDKPASHAGFEDLVLLQHMANFKLWHEEDRARDPDAPDTVIVAVKHSIDALNQQRNDLVEKIDASLYAEAQQDANASLHSETPGMIIDRLSILSLKIFHSREESERADAKDSHKQRNRERLSVLEVQRNDLAAALDALWADVLAGARSFKLYKQMKMYNDPELNPVLYRRHPGQHK